MEICSFISSEDSTKKMVLDYLMYCKLRKCNIKIYEQCPPKKKKSSIFPELCQNSAPQISPLGLLPNHNACLTISSWAWKSVNQIMFTCLRMV